jgi:hypothetical protein
VLKGLGGVRPAGVLAALHGREQREGAEVPADAALLPGLTGQAQPLRRARRGGGVAAGGHLGHGEGLQEIREQDELAGGAGACDRPSVEVVGGRVVAEVASGCAGKAELAGIVKGLGQHDGLAQQRRAPGGVALQDAADPHQQPEGELVDALLVIGEGGRAARRLDRQGDIPRIGCRLARRQQHRQRLDGVDGRDLGRAGGQDRERIGRHATAQLDHTAKVRDVRPQVWPRTTEGRAVQQPECPVRLPGEPGGVRGVHQPAAAQLLGRGELGRALQRPGGGGVPAAAPGPLGRAFQLVGHLGVGLHGRGRPVPGTTVGILLAHQRRRQRLVDGLPLAERRSPVDRRAHQRMVEPDSALGDAHQPGRLGRPERLHAEPERPPGTDDDRRVAGLLSRRGKEQRLGRLREAADPFQEHPLDPGADRQGVGKWRPPGELVGMQ